MSAAERASEASSAEKVNECAVRVNERADESMAQYSTHRFYIISIHFPSQEKLISVKIDGDGDGGGFFTSIAFFCENGGVTVF